VLWLLVDTMLKKKNVNVIIYSGDVTVKASDILDKAKKCFNLDLPVDRIRFVFLRSRSLVEASMYPHFTLLGQSMGSILLASEALLRATPNVFFDSTGYGFTHPIARFLFGCKVGCYVHYPTISTDMLQKVAERRPTYNNDLRVTKSAAASQAKLIYYRLFAALYGFVGKTASIVMVNSTWTRNHISNIWGRKDARIVYPPCDTGDLSTIPLPRQSLKRERLVISIGQFRPEKDHRLQLEAFALYAKRNPQDQSTKLVMIGGCRDEGDRSRVNELIALREKLGVADRVELKVNLPFPALRDYLGWATCGLHTMWNEHFGIGVVEFMAAGVVPIAHNSGGPKSDIVVDVLLRGKKQRTGFLASSVEEYADALGKVFAGSFLSSKEYFQMTEAARAHSATFSDQCFRETTNNCLAGHLH